MKIKNKGKLSEQEIELLQQRVWDLERALNSVHGGNVDALISNNPRSKTSNFNLKKDTDYPYRTLVESMSEGALTLNGTGQILHCNKHFAEMVKMQVDQIIGTTLYIYIPEIQHSVLQHLLQQSKSERTKGEFTLQASDDSIKIVLFSCHQLEFDGDAITIVATDISEIKQIQLQMSISLKEKEVMIKEIYHRVKNNLQVISSLLHMQSMSIQDPVSKNIFIENSARIKAMSLVHQMLYQTGNLAEIEMGKYIKNLASTLADIQHVDENRVKLIIDADSITSNIENAVPYGLLINELISNAYKHAFPNNRAGEIKVSIKHEGNLIVLKVQDNGVGFPEKLFTQSTGTIGMQLIQTLAKQLDGKIELNSSAGTTVTITFPSRCGLG